jgi:hypothetical protein
VGASIHSQSTPIASGAQPARQHRGGDQAEHGLHGHHNGDEGQGDDQRGRKRPVGEHRLPIVQSDISNRAEQIPAVQAQPEHHQHRQEQERHHAEQAGSQ